MGDRKAAIISLFSGLDKDLSYEIDERLSVQVGSMVNVPLRNTTAAGIVKKIEKFDPTKQAFKLRKIYSLVQPEPVLSPDLVELAEWIKSYYCASTQSVLETMIPAVVRSGKSALEAKQVELARELSADELDALKRRAPMQAKIYEFLLENRDGVLQSALMKMLSVSAKSAESLAKKNVVKISNKVVQRAAFDDDISSAESVAPNPHVLNEQQQKAFGDIVADISSGVFKTRLLYGITGSGKTEVYMQTMQKVLESGGSCVFLVPEISLTPQTVGRLRSRFSEYGLVLWHSALTDGQRLDAWRALASGKARIVVGARSCIFAPMKNLRLIIVDEEHDTAYKQDKTPRYNGRDAAVMRAKLCNAACVLGSATPSLETLYNTKIGKYGLSEIKTRVDKSRLPVSFIVDMKYEKSPLLSQMLVDKIAARLERNEQTILFLNRRGYSKLFECPDCGEVATCPHCAVSLTWHKKENIVKCHMCGYTAPAPLKCPKCGSDRAKWKGYGTQKIEDVLASIFPRARIGRMDRDTMAHRDDYRRVLGNFRMGNLDILIGTQMITKGLDFPRVTLVGIIDADISLNMPDFRSAERTYQLIVQVAGRAGRGEFDGEAVIQTKHPEAPPIQYAKRDDMQAFLEEELENRTEYRYPPSIRIIRHIFRARNQDKLAFVLAEWEKRATTAFGDICSMTPPTPAPVERIEDFYRWHICYFTNSVRAVIRAIGELKREFPLDADIEDVIDTDPLSLM